MGVTAGPDVTGPGKRGRRQQFPDPAGGPVAAFAHALVTLKLAAGDPSYERMRTELGAIASRSALSAAARGRDLPSWETTWEFVRCLAPPGADLDALRADWRARRDRAAAAAASVPAAVGPVVAASTGPAGAGAGPASAGPAGAGAGPAVGAGPPRRLRERRLVLLGLLVGATVGGLLWLLVAAAEPDPPPLAGDVAAFAGDVTYPDGTAVEVGSRFVKTWELRNVGTVRWTGRLLQRLPGAAGAGCATPERVPVPDTAPGATVRVSVPVQAPPVAGACVVHWKMVDEQGRAWFPLARPVFFDVRVVAAP
ncbi:MAG: NBR1-Ig-like domain-containing protein [Pseudonocardia sp.]